MSGLRLTNKKGLTFQPNSGRGREGIFLFNEVCFVIYRCEALKSNYLKSNEKSWLEVHHQRHIVVPCLVMLFF